MLGSRPTRWRRLAALTMLLSLALPATGWTWGSTGHNYIAARYSQHLPAFIDGLRAYDSTVYANVNAADQRKSYTPGEEYKHYMDIDSYAEFFDGTLSQDRSVLEAEYGAAVVLDLGVLPWAIGETAATLTQQFAAQSWSAAALTIADLCHYVGDMNQPLHCTKNYNGQFTDNYGIHSRYESTMLGQHVGELSTPAMGVTYHPDAVAAAFVNITNSWGDVEAILDGDSAGVAASGGSYNSTYYTTLWSWTHALTQARLDTATVMTAALVYSAWQDAGRPTVPGSSAEVPPLPVPGPTVYLTAGPSPCHGGVLTVRFSGDGPVSVDVFDVRGARVARLADGVTGPGSVTWRPRAAGAGLGIYFVRMRGPAVDLVRRVIVIG